MPGYADRYEGDPDPSERKLLARILEEERTGDTTIQGPLRHTGSTAGFFNKTPVAQPVANPDTSGATLAALETEVNELKAALRSLGLIAT